MSALTRNADFLKLWAAHTTARLGALMGALGLTAILELDAGPAQVSLLTGITAAPVLIFGLVAGAWADRVRRRPVLIAADIGRALSLGSVPLAWAFGALTIEQLYAVAFVNGALGVFFDVAHPAYVPTVVGRENIIEANSKLTAADAIVEATAFSVAGWVAQLASAIVSAGVNAATFFGSGLLLLSIRKREPAAKGPESGSPASVRRDIAAGLGYVWRDPLLRAITASKVCTGVAYGIVGSIITLYAITELGFEPGILGLIYGAGGISSFFGALYAQRVAMRFGIGPVMGFGMLVMAATGLLIPLATGPLYVAAIFMLVPQLIGDAAWTAHDISEISLRQSITPDQTLGRVNSAITVAYHTSVLAGAAIAGLIAEPAGLRWTIGLGFGFEFLAAAAIFASPLRRVRRAPVSV